jgi:hypothetical protein
MHKCPLWNKGGLSGLAPRFRAKAFPQVLKWKSRLHWDQLSFAFLAILGFSIWLLFGF